MAKHWDFYLSKPKLMAIAILFLYSIQRGQSGGMDMFDAVLRCSKEGVGLRRSLAPLMRFTGSGVFNNASPRAVVLASPHVTWSQLEGGEELFHKWVAAVSAVPYTEEVGQSVVDALLQIAGNCFLQPYIPIGVWSWLNGRPLLPYVCWGRRLGGHRDVVQAVRALGDSEILTSYLIIVWSDLLQNPFHSKGFAEMCMSIRVDLEGIGVGRHREDLIRQLDYISEQLRWHRDYEDYPGILVGTARERKDQSYKLRRVLLEVDREAAETLSRVSPMLICFCLLTATCLLSRIPLDLHVFPASSISLISRFEHSELFPANFCTRLVVSLCFFTLPISDIHRGAATTRPPATKSGARVVAESKTIETRFQ